MFPFHFISSWKCFKAAAGISSNFLPRHKEQWGLRPLGGMEQVSGARQGESPLPAVLLRVFLGPGRVPLKTPLEALSPSIVHPWEMPGRWQNCCKWSWAVTASPPVVSGEGSLRRIAAEAIPPLHGTWTPSLLLLLSQSCPRDPSGLHCVLIRLEFKVGRNFWDHQLNLYFPCRFGNPRNRVTGITRFLTAARHVVLHQNIIPHKKISPISMWQPFTYLGSIPVFSLG